MLDYERTSLVHFPDQSRSIGRRDLTSPRADGSGYVTQVKQYPVICEANYVEEYTGAKAPTSTAKGAVTCPRCRERLDF